MFLARSRSTAVDCVLQLRPHAQVISYTPSQLNLWLNNELPAELSVLSGLQQCGGQVSPLLIPCLASAGSGWLLVLR